MGVEANFSDVGICNSGLLKVGAPPITSFTDNSRASNACAGIYYTRRDKVMREAPWRFALQQIILATPDAMAPAFNYNSAYDIPDNVLRVWQVNDSDWMEVGGQIFCNNPNGINTLCIVQNTDPTSWDAQFAEALAWDMASQLALFLVQSSAMKQEMDKGYKEAMAVARSTNAVISSPERIIADFWSSSRKYGYNPFWPIDAGPPEPYGPV